jgi:glycosyltransferase involved in cell wall biosynthesis
VSATRVLVLIKGLGRGGAELLLAGATPYLTLDRYAYEYAYLLPWKDALVPELEGRGLEVHCLEGHRSAGWPRRLRRLVVEREIALVHAHSPVAAVGARVALWRSPVRVVYTEHNVWPSYHPITRAANRRTYRRNDHVFAVSEDVRSTIRLPRRGPNPPVETLYHGLDPGSVGRWGSSAGIREELGLPEAAPLVGTVANFRPDKGHRFLLEAALRVRRDLPEVRFVLVGLGPVEERERRRVAEMGLQETVMFAGYREDAPRVAGACDLFVLPSVREGLPLALLEAMAVGVPPVVTAAGGMPEVVRGGVDGIVVPVGDTRALASAILSLLGDPARRGRMARSARARAAEFDIRRTVRRMEEVYGSLLR